MTAKRLLFKMLSRYMVPITLLVSPSGTSSFSSAFLDIVENLDLTENVVSAILTITVPRIPMVLRVTRVEYMAFINDTKIMLSDLSTTLKVGNADAGSYFNDLVLEDVDYG